MPTTGIVNATDFGIYVGVAKIANSTGSTISISQALRTSVNKDDGGWEKSLPGARSWSMSGDGEFQFEANYGPEDLIAAILNRTKISIMFSTEVTGDMRLKGDAYVESFESSGGAEENATFSYSFKGTGPITKEDVPVA